MDAVIDWSSLASALIGGLTALSGVYLSQRGEKKRASTQLVWKERVDSYLLLLAHLDRKRAAMQKSLDQQVHRLPEEIQPQLIEDLAPDAEAKVRVFASEKVWATYERYRKRVDDLRLSTWVPLDQPDPSTKDWEPWKRADERYHDREQALITAIRDVQATITAETRGKH